MNNDLLCPHCHHLNDPQVRYCRQCGVDIELAALLAGPVQMGSRPLPFDVPVAPEALVPRLGELLIEKGLLDPSQLHLALEYQQKKESQGKPVLIGLALVELGFIQRTNLDEVVTQQIHKLHQSLQETNSQLEERVEQRTADLTSALARLTELNQLKSNFISNVSHELRTPLTHMKGYLEILSDQSLGPLTPLQVDAIEVIKRAESRLETLIEDLIQLSLAAKGEIQIQIKPASLIESIDPVLTQIAIKARSKDISMKIQISGELPPVLMDEKRIGWVVNQLLDNAIKFTPRGGIVGLSAAREQDFVKILVQDTGIGIPAERISEIFEPFHQLDSTISRRYPGTGLGLAMVQRILDVHGSLIKCKSNEGQGSLFEFSLPLAIEDNERADC